MCVVGIIFVPCFYLNWTSSRDLWGHRAAIAASLLLTAYDLLFLNTSHPASFRCEGSTNMVCSKRAARIIPKRQKDNYIVPAKECFGVGDDVGWQQEHSGF